MGPRACRVAARRPEVFLRQWALRPPHFYQKRHAECLCTPQDEMGSAQPPALVYTVIRRDAGKRTWSLRREYTPDQKRSVLLAAPQQVEPRASRVGCAQPLPEAPVSRRLTLPCGSRGGIGYASCASHLLWD